MDVCYELSYVPPEISRTHLFFSVDIRGKLSPGTIQKIVPAWPASISSDVVFPNPSLFCHGNLQLGTALLG